jgi:sugar lactone lactonase YvrE
MNGTPTSGGAYGGGGGYFGSRAGFCPGGQGAVYVYASTRESSYRKLITSGSGEFVVPERLFKLRVVAIGGGGSSYKSMFGASDPASGKNNAPYLTVPYDKRRGGGGGGTAWTTNFSCLPRQKIPYSVGVGGVNGDDLTVNADGGDTTFGFSHKFVRGGGGKAASERTMYSGSYIPRSNGLGGTYAGGSVVFSGSNGHIGHFYGNNDDNPNTTFAGQAGLRGNCTDSTILIPAASKSFNYGLAGYNPFSRVEPGFGGTIFIEWFLTPEYTDNPVSNAIYSVPGNYKFIVPHGVNSLRVVAVGGGGADYGYVTPAYSSENPGGGGIAWMDDWRCYGGQEFDITVARGGRSYFSSVDVGPQFDAQYGPTDSIVAEGGSQLAPIGTLTATGGRYLTNRNRIYDSSSSIRAGNWASENLTGAQGDKGKYGLYPTDVNRGTYSGLSQFSNNMNVYKYGLAVKEGEKAYDGVVYIEWETSYSIPKLIAGSSGGYVDGPDITSFSTYKALAATNGSIYVAETSNHVILKVAGGSVSIFAGDCSAGYSDGVGINSKFNTPRGIAVDGGNNVYVADTGNHVIRKILPNGTVSTIGGNGSAGYCDVGAGQMSQFNSPQGIACDRAGNVYISDTGNNLIRMIDKNGNVSTIAGVYQNPPSSASPTDGYSNAATFDAPTKIAINFDGTKLYVTDNKNSTIRTLVRANPDSMCSILLS